MLYQYELLKEYLKAWKKSKDINGLLLEGNVGISKSYSVEEVLKDESYLLVNSHITPLKLYQLLYETRTSFLIIDDVLELFKSKDTSGLLIAALQSGNKSRTLTWYTTSEKLGKVPLKFGYKGKIAIICNKLPGNLDHLKSRCFYFELKLNYSEMIKKLEEVGKAIKLNPDIMKFVKKNTIESTPKDILNIRLLIKLNSLYQEFPKKWKELGLYLIKQDKNLYILKKIIDKYDQLSDQIRVYEELVGRKKTCFYMDKKILMN